MLILGKDKDKDELYSMVTNVERVQMWINILTIEKMYLTGFKYILKYLCTSDEDIFKYISCIGKIVILIHNFST